MAHLLLRSKLFLHFPDSSCCNGRHFSKVFFFLFLFFQMHETLNPFSVGYILASFRDLVQGQNHFKKYENIN